MKIIEILRKDKELKMRDYILYQKNAPPYNYDEYYGVEDYKKKLQSKL